jgi:Uma2 family endonuclease
MDSRPAELEHLIWEVPLYRLNEAQTTALYTAGILQRSDPVAARAGLLIVTDPEGYPHQQVRVEGQALPIARLSVSQYHHLLTAGILHSGDPVELLEGLLVEKMTKNRAHTLAKRRAYQALLRLIPAGYYLEEQEPIRLATSEPEPDIMVVRGRDTDYLDDHPPGSAIALVIEVSDSTAGGDRRRKAELYAAAGIPVYIIINLRAERIEVQSQPSDRVYLHTGVYRADDAVPLVIDGVQAGQVRAADLLP